MNLISATIVADSKNTFGQRITTMKLVFPRIVLAEFNTHRALSRNSASSRAIPFKRMLKMVQEQGFTPIQFQRDHSGMQGSEVLEGADLFMAQKKWNLGKNLAILAAKGLNLFGVTKQLANRLLEPFMYHTVLTTFTEIDNFFALRFDPMAEIHIKDLAEKMLVVYNDSTPVQLKPGEWHIPFGDKLDQEWIRTYLKATDEDFGHKYEDFGTWSKKQYEIAIKIATARCARLSYETLGDDPKIDYAADIRLHDQLLAGGHMSPFEHCARAMNDYEMASYMVTEPSKDGISHVGHRGWCGNFRGFIQYRKMLPNENRTDSRVIKK